MVDPGCLPVNRKRGNPNWGRPMPPSLALPTEFDLLVKQLELTAEMYTSSAALRAWCRQNKDRVYIPEWLLKELCIAADAA